MKKYIILSFLLVGLLGFVQAQEGGSKYAPAAGDISVSLLFGQGNFFDGGLTVPGSPSGNGYWTVPGNAPNANMVSENYNNFTNMVGIEARYFLASNMAVKVSGGAIIRSTPARDNVPGFIDPAAPNVTWIPDFDAVTQNNEFKMHFTLAGEMHFASKFERISPYLGFALPFYYSRHSQYNPTYNVDLNSGAITITDVSVRHAEIRAFGAQIAAGADIYLTEGLYLGIEVKPFSYLYAYNAKFPAAGLDPLKADTHTFGFFSQPNLKLGFRF